MDLLKTYVWDVLQQQHRNEVLQAAQTARLIKQIKPTNTALRQLDNTTHGIGLPNMEGRYHAFLQIFQQCNLIKIRRE